MQTYPACKELLVSINNYATVSQCQKTFYLELEKTALILTLKFDHDKLHCTLFVMYCLDFREKIDLDISYESSTSRQFTGNVVPYSKLSKYCLFFVDSFIIA